MSAAFLRAPLCPAGHLPHKGGDQMSSPPSLTANVVKGAPALELLISPQVEMSGRTEGGAVPPALPFSS
ncbi:hypothetical protein FKO01_41175 [Mesorhizobium sp. B2-3-3]|nr:hypothetical protein FKO01_41175 [Mesorhizobium sp. B2-3-3]